MANKKTYSAPEIQFGDKLNKTELYYNVASRDLARKRVRDCKHIQDLRRERENPQINADLLDLYLAIIRVHVETEEELVEFGLKFNENFANPLSREDVLKAAQFTFLFRDETGKPVRQDITANRAVALLDLTEDEQMQLETFRTAKIVRRLGYLKRKNPEPTKQYQPQSNLKVFEIDPQTMPTQDEEYLKKHRIYQAKKKRPAESYKNQYSKKALLLPGKMIARTRSKWMGVRNR